MSQLLTYIGHVCYTIGKRFITDRLTSASATLTFTTLLALVPLLTIAIAIFSAFPMAHSFSNDVSQFILQNFVPTSGEVVQKYLHNFINQAGKLSLVGTIALIITVILMMITIEQAFNNIWKTQQRQLNLAAFLRYWAILSLAPIFIGLSIAATSYIITLPVIIGTATKLGMRALLLNSTPWVLTILILWLLYVAVPNCKVPWRYGFIGALLATILFEIAKKGFVLYINNFATYSFIYGAVAIIPIFLVWLYLLWMIILLGSLIANVLTMHYFTGKTGTLDGFTHAFLWLGYLWQAQRQGKSMSLKQLYGTLAGHYAINANQQLQYLLQAKLVAITSRKKYVLARDFSHITLADLYKILPWKLPQDIAHTLLPKKAQDLLANTNLLLQEKLHVPLSELYNKND